MGVTTLVDSSKGLKFTESPRWHNGELWFLDIHGRAIKKVSMDGALETVVDLPFLPNSLGFTPDGKAVFGDGLKRVLYILDGKEYKQLADISGVAKICLSDGMFSAQGNYYVGDIGFDFLAGAMPAPTGTIVLVKPDGQASVVADNLFFPNGMVITPDGKTLIVAETFAHCLTAFDVKEDGTLANRRKFAQLPGTVGAPDGVCPDGICVDAENAVWVATAVGSFVLRVREGGEVTQRIDIENLSFAVMLGGSDRKTLCICSSHTHNPQEIMKAANARIELVKVDVPGAGCP